MTLAQTWSLQVPCTLEQTLNGLDIWVEEHKMKLNPKKCKVLHVTHMRHPPTLPTLSTDQNILEVCDTVKVLGVTIQSNSQWDSQVDHMLTAANRKVFVLRRLKKFGVRDPKLVSIYTGYVRPVLEYAVPVWHSSLTTAQAERLESINGLVKLYLAKENSAHVLDETSDGTGSSLPGFVVVTCSRACVEEEEEDAQPGSSSLPLEDGPSTSACPPTPQKEKDQ
ncbi:hypothetical protein SKAU_G00131720 [Synaphobranchus kaupii]|uniref:Reverse transcriptase n=1 Tax=Synaphobranchus kaupii TaxID=118154 RepID=A0A9Q1J329_SYNKA|nr:hypothetical protein SKAU_G00131720 [Synaphobranchus kaupii]